jgi:hypothetical protein
MSVLQISKNPEKVTVKLKYLEIREMFRLSATVHQHLGPDDICMKIRVPSSYLNEDHKYAGRGEQVPIVNLSTGRLAMIDGDREVIPLKTANLYIEDV